jgi:NCS1 family nucleobase:cation symporter-1
MLIGAFAVLVGGNAFGVNSIGYLAGQFPGISTLLFAALLLSLVPAGAEGPYGAFLTSLASITERGVRRTNGTKVRVAFMTVFTIIATVLAIAASSNLLKTFENITLFLLYLLVPWTAINLTDYYLVRRGDYDVPELFKRRGLYGFLNVRAVVLYLVAIVVEIPFINSSLYEGPIAKQMGGADISWIVGLAVSAAGYFILVRPGRTEPKTLVTGE